MQQNGSFTPVASVDVYSSKNGQDSNKGIKLLRKNQGGGGGNGGNSFTFKGSLTASPSATKGNGLVVSNMGLLISNNGNGNQQQHPHQNHHGNPHHHRHSHQSEPIIRLGSTNSNGDLHGGASSVSTSGMKLNEKGKESKRESASLFIKPHPIPKPSKVGSTSSASISSSTTASKNELLKSGATSQLQQQQQQQQQIWPPQHFHQHQHHLMLDPQGRPIQSNGPQSQIQSSQNFNNNSSYPPNTRQTPSSQPPTPHHYHQVQQQNQNAPPPTKSKLNPRQKLEKTLHMSKYPLMPLEKQARLMVKEQRKLDVAERCRALQGILETVERFHEEIWVMQLQHMQQAQAQGEMQ
jgi:hypothetical protein